MVVVVVEVEQLGVEAAPDGRVPRRRDPRVPLADVMRVVARLLHKVRLREYTQVRALCVSVVT